MEHGVVDDPKTPQGRRVVSLIPETAEALQALRHDRPYVFSPPRGAFYRPNTCSHILKAACREAGVREITWHKLRHTCATDLTARGVPLLVVKNILGHASIEMTMRYAHVAPDTARDYMQVLRDDTHVNDLPALPEAFVHQVSTKLEMTPEAGHITTMQTTVN